MFQVNDVIIYGSQGVFEITAIEEKSISGAKRECFALGPIKEQGSTIYVPTDNATKTFLPAEITWNPNRFLRWLHSLLT